MKILQTYPLLLCAALLLTGFSWGLGTDPCKNALEIAATLDTSRNEALVRKDEEKIIAQCPDGAAAHFVGALRQAPSFARASGNLGLLYARKWMNDEASVELARGLSSISNPLYHKAMARIL